ncbi:MAG TPA: D-2-hydroxyacid dehydrogenase [Pelomicrobium sp.]|nr:D-2-hydroxyacid dehydrogenase [Pelomicrobium sp.]
MHRVVFLDRSTIEADIRRPAFAHEWVDYPLTAPAEILPRLAGVTIAVVNKVPMRAEALAQLPALRKIAVCATGTDNVDLEYCRGHGIVVSNIRGYGVHAVPEHVFTLILALRRNLLAYRDDVRRGRWQEAPFFCLFSHPIRDLHGSRLGIIGRGGLGDAVARLGEAFGMRVAFAERKGVKEPRAGYQGFDRVIAESDVISLHCPLTPATRGLIGEQELRAMKRDAVLINTARGGLVDERALVRALDEGWIAGAGFDVLSVEPPREGNPLLGIERPNFILTPHVAWASREAMQVMADQLIDNIEAYVAGEPRNRVA